MENQDVDRALTLLWRRTLGVPQGKRGPKQRVSVDEVVAAAIKAADEEGLAAFSMRKVTDRLGMKPMSIYTYVPGRSELIGLMIDEVAGEVELPEHTGDLRARVTAVARQTWDEIHRHPWLLQTTESRPWIGPNLSDRYEWQLAAIEGEGFTDLEMDLVVNLVVTFASSAARASIEARRMTEESGITDAEWWRINEPILTRIMPGDRYPISGRVGLAAGEEYNAISNPEKSFQFGLDRLIAGLDDLLKR